MNRQELTRKLLVILRESGLEIMASSVDEYQTKPWAFDRCIPDVVAYDSKKQLVILGSASTCEILEDVSSAEKLRTLASQAMDEGASKGEAVPFHLIVPEACSDKVRDYLRELGLNYNVILWTA